MQPTPAPEDRSSSPEDAFARWLRTQGYLEVRRLPDGSYAGLVRLLFTTGLCLGLDAESWKARFCFEDLEDARRQLQALQTVEDVPAGWVARRP